MRVFQHCYFDLDRLVEQIDHLTKVYGTGNTLYTDITDGVRTRHVFVAALRSDTQGYNLFRTYQILESAIIPKKLIEGPENPRTFEISSAFGVTGATKYFSRPWKEQMASSGKTRFLDNNFPKPHNITKLALDEMWGLYGPDVLLSAVVNIGPGLPNSSNVELIARRLSWGLKWQPKRTLSFKQSKSPTAEGEPPRKKRSFLKSRVINAQQKKIQFQRRSIRDRRVEGKLMRLESGIERDIKQILSRVCPGGESLYI
jgi:hypothetical protein